ncbi:paraquat-inducible protein A [Motilimonas cestriensis]|uniref:Paraquat-inducible protein A n=1 Tax=Motilimonas cestriensis TaxID=2742685 RepID=A0ABS8WAW5_9GAMM|nr:paraquat-inducible protein A [Motilimonas cestriensis]MCE2595242.1 paraquat-inducible protein A [Motilimonas cestriensis]
MQSAKDAGLVRCSECALVCSFQKNSRCPRCNALLTFRQTNSLQKTWAFLLTACIFIIPANFMPITVLISQGKETPDTILSGVITLVESGSPGIAIIVFVASIVVPLAKILGMGFILISLQLKLNMSHRMRFIMFKFIDWVGRWSMLDLFVISIMVAVIDKGQLLVIVPGPGATAFASVVILTLLAAKSFDTRLMWDLEKDNDWTN